MSRVKTLKRNESHRSQETAVMVTADSSSAFWGLIL